MAPRPRAATRRIDRGRSHEYVLDGVKADGVTTLINGGIPKPALTGWAAREVAELVCQRREILQEMTDDEIVDFLKGAPFRTRDRAANRGTEVHALAAKLARGEKVEVPEELIGHVDAYLDWRRRWDPQDELVERTIVNRRYRFAGTFDLWCRLPGLGACLIDLKTNRSGPFGEVAVQLAAYAHGEAYLDSDGVERPMPAIEWFGVLWLTGDSWELVPFDVTEREFRTFLYAAETARWVQQRAQAVRGYPLAPPSPQLTIVEGASA